MMHALDGWPLWPRPYDSISYIAQGVRGCELPCSLRILLPTLQQGEMAEGCYFAWRVANVAKWAASVVHPVVGMTALNKQPP